MAGVKRVRLEGGKRNLWWKRLFLLFAAQLRAASSFWPHGGESAFSPSPFSPLLRRKAWRSVLLLRPTASPWGSAVNLQARRAAISAPSASAGSSGLSATAGWATLAAEHVAATHPANWISSYLQLAQRGAINPNPWSPSLNPYYQGTLSFTVDCSTATIAMLALVLLLWSLQIKTVILLCALVTSKSHIIAVALYHALYFTNKCIL